MKTTDYINSKPIATMHWTNTGGLAILDIIHGIDDYVIVKLWTAYSPDSSDIYAVNRHNHLCRPHKLKLYCNNKGIYFKFSNGLRYYLHDFIRCNY